MSSQAIPSDLYDAVKGKNWCEAARILEDPANHIQVEYVGAGALGVHGTNTVHWAAFHPDTPHDLMKKMTSISRNACMTPQKFGALPLHSACRFSCDENTVMLAETWPEAASVPDLSEGLALHHVVIHGRSTKVMKAVLKANPKAALHTNQYNESPLSIFLEEWDSGLESCVLTNSTPLIFGVLNTSISDCGGRKCSLKVLFERTLLLLKGAVNQEIDEEEDDKTYPLHLALQIPFLPFSFFKVFLLVHPDHVWMKDKKGNLPLHLACATPNNTSNKMIQDLLNTNPKAARTLDGSQRLPLHIALEHGNYAVVKEIIKSAPETVKNCDPLNNLLPFMAASIGNTKKDENELEQLDTIYFLMTKDPSFVSWALKSNASRKRKRDNHDVDRSCHGTKNPSTDKKSVV